MVFPFRFTSPFLGTGRVVLGSIEQCGSRWQGQRVIDVSLTEKEPVLTGRKQA